MQQVFNIKSFFYCYCFKETTIPCKDFKKIDKSTRKTFLHVTVETEKKEINKICSIVQ